MQGTILKLLRVPRNTNSCLGPTLDSGGNEDMLPILQCLRNALWNKIFQNCDGQKTYNRLANFLISQTGHQGFFVLYSTWYIYAQKNDLTKFIGLVRSISLHGGLYHTY